MTIWTAPFADGWNAEQNARGDLGCGGGGTHTDPPTVRLVLAGHEDSAAVISTGRFIGWRTDDQLLYLPLDKPGEIWAASYAQHATWPIAAAAEGNSLRAADGHWGSALVTSDAVGRVLYDGNLLYAGAMWDGLAIAGERLLHTVPDPTDGWPCLQEYVGGVKARLKRLPANANSFTLQADGWIGAGHFGTPWVLRPGYLAFEPCTVTPWELEGAPVVVIAPDGTPWLWTATGSPSGRYMVLGRPLGSRDCITIDGLPCAWLRVRILNGQWSIVAVDGGGQLRVATVPLDAPRHPVPWEPPAPTPVPWPPIPVPPFPVPDMLNRPGVTIDHWDPTISPTGGWKTILHNRGNPEHGTWTIEFKNGYFTAALVNAAGDDRSGAQNRHVTITP